jgi:hypothetical protein
VYQIPQRKQEIIIKPIQSRPIVSQLPQIERRIIPIQTVKPAQPIKSIQVKEIQTNQPLNNESNNIDGMEKISPLINDPMVQLIDCPGPEKIVSITSFGQIKTTGIILSKEEIDQILQNFSDKSRIPLIPGVFKALIENLSVTAVISELLGNRFVIQKRSRLV